MFGIEAKETKDDESNNITRTLEDTELQTVADKDGNSKKNSNNRNGDIKQKDTDRLSYTRPTLSNGKTYVQSQSYTSGGERNPGITASISDNRTEKPSNLSAQAISSVAKVNKPISDASTIINKNSKNNNEIMKKICSYKLKYLTYPAPKTRLKKYFDLNLFMQSLPSLIICLISQFICGLLLQQLQNDKKLKQNFPVVVIVDCALIFLGNLEVSFDINVLSAISLIECRGVYMSSSSSSLLYDSNTNINNITTAIPEKNVNTSVRNNPQFIAHIKKSSLYLLFNSFLVSLIITTIASFYKMVFSEYSSISWSSSSGQLPSQSISLGSVLYSVLVLALCITPTCLISMIITIISILLTILICKRYNINPDNIGIPLVSSINEVMSVLIIKGFLIWAQSWRSTELIVIGCLCGGVVLLIVILLWVYEASYSKVVAESESLDGKIKVDTRKKNVKNEGSLEKKYEIGPEISIENKIEMNSHRQIAVSSPHISTYIVTFIGITISTCLIEKVAETQPVIALISLSFCGLIINIIMIYTARICTQITKYFEKRQRFIKKTKRLLNAFKILPTEELLDIFNLSDKESFKLILKECIKIETSTVYTLTLTSILLTSIYFVVFIEFLKTVFFEISIICLFSVSGVFGIFIIPYLLEIEFWLNSKPESNENVDFVDFNNIDFEPDSDNENNENNENNKNNENNENNENKSDLMNGKLGGSTLIFSTIIVDVIGSVCLCGLFMFYGKT